ncbi:MAG: ABC transporter ATP-binding protein [Thermomonas sp.]|uniref:ABC transporter ATP-binding protein n=1 Tax=Thermomonas sp. TaxID=1971895 RepID=UPI001D43CACF|nr:ABC transporter ATP-binding protein [Thermomonas sp.]MBZ0086818.1 ABC transporter ATP-binding protein [Thermomonas sp.]
MADISPATEATAISLRGVHKHFGALRAVDGVDLDIRTGEILGLIGHNGAGKSTLFKLMLGLETPSAGAILIDGIPVRGRAFRAVRRGIGFLPESVVLYDNLDGLETLRFFARLKGAPLAQCAQLLEQVGLNHAGKRPVREYSKGMRQRLGFAQALLGKPRVLFLDEPTNGLDPEAIRDFYVVLRQLQAAGTTIVITSHILAELQGRVDRLAIMAAGKLLAVGSVQDLRERTALPLVIEADLDAADLATVAAALQELAPAPETTPTGLRWHCPRQHKMAALAALGAQNARVHDLRLLEPSLEDMFFGLSR